MENFLIACLRKFVTGVGYIVVGIIFVISIVCITLMIEFNVFVRGGLYVIAAGFFFRGCRAQFDVWQNVRFEKFVERRGYMLDLKELKSDRKRLAELAAKLQDIADEGKTNSQVGDLYADVWERFDLSREEYESARKIFISHFPPGYYDRYMPAEFPPMPAALPISS